MRAEFILAMGRASEELERELVDQRIDEAFEQVYEYLEPAATYLRSTCDSEGCRALERLERAYFRAIEIAARSGIGCRPSRAADVIPQRRAVIPTAPRQDAGDADLTTSTSPANADMVLSVNPWR